MYNNLKNMLLFINILHSFLCGVAKVACALLLSMVTIVAIATIHIVPCVANDLSDTTGEHATYLKNHTITIYKYIATAKEIATVQFQLKEQGIEVFSIETGYDGLVYPLSDSSTDTANITDDTKKNAHSKMIIHGKILIIRVKKSEWGHLQNKGFHLCSTLHKKGGHCYRSSYANLFPETHHKKYVSIYKTTGHDQCTEEKDIEWNLEQMADTLTQRGVFIYKYYKGTSGEILALQCGYDTNHINVYVIESSKLGIALSLGFHECAWLKTQGQNCYTY